MSTTQTTALKIASVLWIIWGLVHAFAGVMVISSDAAGGFAAILDAMDPASFQIAWPEGTGALLNQHAWNLLWGGVVTIIAGALIWRRNMTAIWLAAMVGGLLDLGYFMFVDLGDYVHFLPGTLMTLISASAILLSGWVWLANRTSSQGA
jgi:hypothetical protein